ncbi:MAG TPA: hypothetical protein VND64_04410 [Pirellulales bacterium]|nr:hypothetical protein [Pirellulales bacterium]
MFMFLFVVSAALFVALVLLAREVALRRELEKRLDRLFPDRLPQSRAQATVCGFPTPRRNDRWLSGTARR